MYGLLIVTLLSLTIGSISTETENVEVVPVLLNSKASPLYTGNFSTPLQTLDIIQFCGKMSNTGNYVTIRLKKTNFVDVLVLTLWTTGQVTIKIGQYFFVQIYVDNLKFDAYLNGKYLATYENKYVPLEDITTITAEGYIDSATYLRQLKIFPNASPICQSCAYESGIVFRTNFPALVTPGQIITIIGKPSGTSGQFSVNFVGNNNVNKILFHFNPRFGQKKIVLNSMNDNLSWENAVQFSLAPFKLNEKFKLVFGLTTTSFKIAANGVYIGTFNYRQVNIFEILNGFIVNEINGLKASISSVDYLQTGSPNLDNIAEYSKF